MYSHIMLGADDLDASKAFYDAVLGALGHGPGRQDDKGRVFWFTKTGIFAVSLPIDGNPACGANGSTIGFAAASPEQADAFHAAGLAHGGTAIEDPPGVRDPGGMNLYLSYLRDPAGNKICAMHRMA
jgi:catechol 2,3-dioxygenase-like lactoylglutathione lyase family enzyme